MADDKKKKDQQATDDEDPRLDFLLNYMIKSYRLKQDKWNKMIAIPENKNMITNFFDNPKENMLILTIPMSGVLTPLTAFSPLVKQKFTYFIRKKPLPVTMDNLRDVLTFGDMAGKFLDELSVLIEGLYVPLLSNPKNQKGWPKMLADDVITHVRDFRNQMDQIYGALKSETVLPMPSGLSRVYQAQTELRDYKILDFELKNAFENAVIQWADIIKEVLKQSPSLAFEHGENPLPEVEIEFWSARVKNLQSIYNQLRDPRIKKMAEFLQEAKSSYGQTFQKLFKDAVAALVEARDINFYLKPLVPHIEKFMSNDILDIPDAINPMVHVVGLIWANSRHYCTNERIINLLKCISNMLIEGVERQIDPSSIFQGEAEENFERLHKCIEVLNSYEEALDYVRDNIGNYYRDQLEGEEPVEQKRWIFHRRNVIQRILDFLNRLKVIENILGTKMEYTKLEKVEFGGLRGRILSLKCEEVFEDFNKAFNVFNNIQYDPMDLKDESLFKDYKEFEEKVSDMDLRLAAIFSQALDECDNIESIIKFWNILGSLYQRPKIFEELSVKFPRLIDLLDQELDTVKILYDDSKKNGIPIDKYYPPMAGTLLWLNNLRTRIAKPYEDIVTAEIQEVYNENFDYVQKKYKQMIEILTNDFDSTLNSWCDYAPGQIEISMTKFQIARIDDGNLIAVNIDDELKAILREIKYLKMMEIDPLPEKVQQLYEKSEELLEVLFKFYRIVEWYNWLKEDTIHVELDLIKPELDDIDQLLSELENHYTWTTNDNDYVDKVFKEIQNLYDRVKEAQMSINNFTVELNEWRQTPFYERKDGKKENLINLEDRSDRKLKRKNQMAEFSDRIKEILKRNYMLYFNELSEEEPKPEEEAVEEAAEAAEKEKAAEEAKGKGKEKGGAKAAVDKAKKPKKTDEELAKEAADKAAAEAKAQRHLVNVVKWAPYVDYIMRLIQDRMIEGTMNSLQLFLNEMGEVEPVLPFFEISMELHEPYIAYIPSAKITDSDSLFSLLEDLIDDIIRLTSFMYKPNVDNKPLDYYDVVKVDNDVMERSDEIMKKVTTACEEAISYTGEFDEYMDLWTENRQTYLSQFLTYGRGLSPFEVDMINEGTTEIKENPPTITQFKEIIDYYENLYKKVETVELYKVLPCKWLKIDVRHLRQSILNLVCKWSNLFKQHLYDHVTNSLQDLEEFIKEAIAVMQIPLSEDDYDGLIKVMSYLVKVKERQVETDAMFRPLKEIMDLLKEYGMEFPEEIHVQLQEIPDRWMQCKKTAAAAKAAVGPLQALQINAIKRRMNLFEIRQNMFRNQFKQMPIFGFECKDVYKALDKANSELTGLEGEMAQLNEQASLFELTLAEMKALKTTRKEIKLLKQLWDFANIVRSCVDEWIYTPWKKIDVENMEIELKKFAKELRQMDKEMKGWDVYIKLNDMIKNMLTSLRAVTELQNPAIRDRHWVQLMQATKVKFVMDDSTTLNDLLKLHLHKYEDEIKNIVDRSVKEMAMEKVLKELNTTWATLEYSVTPHERTHLKLLGISEEIIETLEENQVALQNMMSSKYIDFFLGEVSDWQMKLSNADQVNSAFMEVQRKWGYLESIFVGSDDIRKQLPEDSKRFDKCDKDFRDVLGVIGSNLNIIRATSKPGLFERLENIRKDLILCEKALNNYLETKRLAFPRFYFVSDPDLLDILSNGNQPDLIQRHLPKLFDSIKRLTFVQEGGKNSKTANGMISKENEEFVKLTVNCDCTGQVELWLNRVVDVMRKTLHQYLLDAVTTYDEKPRETFICECYAQIALCGTQIWWTTEVNLAFAKLEEGYENALKDYQRKQIVQLNGLINLLLGELTEGERQKICTICTIDVHARDVVAAMITMKVENSQSFQWQRQLRHRWDEKMTDCFANICDAEFKYYYEYLGNTPRLVITPLTDRCYITLTQSLHLIMGSAPAGPAGTGKTETTKDLGKALGMMVYVFNCSEQMDYQSIGNIYKGLSQAGCWGCFDEFNRISIEVLSVVAVQVKIIQDAIKSRKSRFIFLEQEISLVSTVGLFITMNPGYAGRTELPENLKSLFRPCAMVVPDIELICEIMLVSAGFIDGRLLARKFITLYSLCKELLSKQDHYDWGLRAVKSVLVVAGALRRDDRQRPEDQVLMRALRDFNLPKIISDDVPVFMGLIGDLFPALDVPRKRNMDFEKVIKKSALDLKLQPEEGFILKIVQLEELLAVRHSVFILGFAGTGKSMVWKTLNRTHQNLNKKPIFNDLDPKAVTNDELFGVINRATREWKDGLFSVIMRDQANLTGDGPKWIVLDGDIDPMWIESLNTVMDDNKVLTLASNERIALTTQMRLLFEIANLRTATPATVSRAGILYINPSDLGWNPYIASWIDTREQQSEKANLMILFDKYIPSCLETLKKKFKKITPISDIAHLQMLTTLLDCFLTPQNVPAECPKEWYEIYFAFSVVWAFGSALFQDQIVDWRNEFSKWFTEEFKTVKFPITGNVFSFYIEEETKKFLPWQDLVPSFELDPDVPLQATLVNTAETTRIRYFVDRLLEKKKPIMLVGGAGSGKTVLVADKLHSLSDKYAVTNVPLNYYTTSEMLQRILEKPLEKKAGRVFGPPGTKTMIYFIDDMNMPEVDKYFTVQPHTLIRQYMDYQHWYDRQKLTLKDIHNIQIISCMNPTAGSFTIDPRLQRHFCVFAMSYPSSEALFHIYHTILSQHIANPDLKYADNLRKLTEPIVQTALGLHQKMQQTFLPTAIKFHYIFTLRDMSNIFQGMLFTTGTSVSNQIDFIRLWMHEAHRVYEDKLVDRKDIDTFKKLMIECVKKGFEDYNENDLFEMPLIFSHFSEGIGDPKYYPLREFTRLASLLDEALRGYNDLVAAMNLVLFEDAMYHVCRINRILESPRGNGLLVGVGGSGKQSLTRLSAFISSFEVFQIQLRKGYTINDMKDDIAGLYNKAGLKSLGVVFLMTDAQVPEEKFLVLINDLLASGEISELFADEDVENIINALRNEVKGIGMQDTRENCWTFFIDRVRRLLKVILSFSPVGSTLRVRARQFPALVNCSSIDWFHEWPQEALESVSKRFVANIKVLPKDLSESVALFMSHVHASVNKLSEQYYLNEKRYNYTTPKSFLEQIALYEKMLTKKVNDTRDAINRLETGLTKLESASVEADSLKDVLAVQKVELAEKNEMAGKVLEVLQVESVKVEKEKNIATEEEAKVRIIEEDVAQKAKVCAADLEKAEPALVAAEAALNTLNANNLKEMKSYATPPEAIVWVCAAVLILFSKGKIPKDQSWKACKIMMAKVDQFLQDLLNFDKDNMTPETVKAVQEYTKKSDFTPEKIVSKSTAAAGLCAWVINILKYYDVFVVVEPKRKAHKAAQQELSDARKRLADLNAKLKILEDQYDELKNQFDDAMSEKLRCQAEADETALKLDLADRLINGLASENIRWRQQVKDLKESRVTFPGNILLVSAFISYVGSFTRNYRQDLINKYMMPFLTQNLQVPIPLTENIDPLMLLTDDAEVAGWNNEGLPTDRMSTENACILLHSARWPLMIDPQLQGIKWVKTHYGDQLKIIRLTTKNYLDIIERAIADGDTILLENIGETVDAVLDPVLGRVLIKKGKCIRIGDREIDYNPQFRMILHTKLANPHYKPEIQAQTTLINFTVTRDGLEEQLLAEVVKAERPDLENLKSTLTKQQNEYKITIKRCQDNLLFRLSSATGNILGDVELVLNLETTKKTATEVEIKVEEAKVTSVKIDEAREQYRPCATRASIIYFILNDLYHINALYHFSLKAFTVVFRDALKIALPAENLKERLVNLLDSVTFASFMYTTRGLFERDKLTFMAQMTFQILLNSREIQPDELDFLLRFPAIVNLTTPVDFLTNIGWGGIKALAQFTDFKNLDKDLEQSAKRWRKFVDSECPEKEKFPGEWKTKTALQKLCIMRALRPDRMTYAVSVFIEEELGSKYITARSLNFEKSFRETSNAVPVFFILSPGVNPLKDVEKLGSKLGFTFDSGNFHSVSLGQGQEIVAENAIDKAAEQGHWVILQNIHLVKRWLPTLEKKMEQYIEDSHHDYRLYLSAEPDADPHACVIPQGILESCLKITNEPPTGMYANLHKALDNFTQETLEMCTKESEFKAILFALCYFHAVVAERRKFGPQGWNRNYPFNVGDLTISVNVLYNYLENNNKVPWEDLRYLFGEIMYGGHITDDWDRRLCRSYLLKYMQPELLEGDLQFAPHFYAPPNMDYDGYHRYIDDRLPPESPYLYGLHPNAEIGFLATISDEMFLTIFEMQPKDTGGSAAGGVSHEETVRGTLEDILDRLPEKFRVSEMMSRVEDKTPYIIVAFQECERMNNLTKEMKRSLTELQLGLKGELTITSEMETLDSELFMGKVPETWANKAYPSMLPLGQWVADLGLRIKELENWTTDFAMPPTVWLGGFFNPQSFLTAIMQQTARKNEWPLDKMCLMTDVTKKQKEDFNAAPREGSYVHGLFMEGARWDASINSIADSKLKELFPVLPVIFIKAITQDKQDLRNMYDCPVYKTRTRGPTYVWTFNLRTKDKALKWTLAGVAILLQI